MHKYKLLTLIKLRLTSLIWLVIIVNKLNVIGKKSFFLFVYDEYKLVKIYTQKYLSFPPKIEFLYLRLQTNTDQARVNLSRM